jgi:hypothetical protein
MTVGSMSPSHRAALRRSTWQRIRRILTVGVFVTATVTGIGVGLNGASISPVAPAADATTAPMPPNLQHGDVGRVHLGHT